MKEVITHIGIARHCKYGSRIWGICCLVTYIVFSICKDILYLTLHMWNAKTANVKS